MTSSTHKTYKAAEKRYLTFCNNFSLPPLPASENVLCYFAACLGQEGLAYSSIRTYLSGVRQVQIAAGYPDPSIVQMPRLHQVIKGIRVLVASSGKAPRPRLPITPSILHKFRSVWLEHPTYNNIMLWAACTTTFFGFCRSGEITVESASKFVPQIHLSLSDLAVDNTQAPQVISIKLKRSKTDHGDSPGPLFRWANREPLTKTKFVDHVRKGLITANIPAHLYTGHSFRIGAATIAASVGIEDSTIQTLGRWKSSAYLLYIKLNPSHLATLSSTMAKCSI